MSSMEMINKAKENFAGSILDSGPVLPGNDNGAVLLGTKKTSLSYRQALKLFERIEPKLLSTKAPFNPRGGDVYMYGAEAANHYGADGFRWQSGIGWNKLPSQSNTMIYSKRHKVVTADSGPTGDSRFLLYMFKLPIDQSPLLVHYIGDESVFKPFPHKSSKKDPKRPFVRSAPTIGENVKANMDVQTQQLYQEMLFDPSAGNNPAYLPRDRKQVENFKNAENARIRLSHDSLYNLYVLGFEYSDFVKEYRADFDATNNLVFLVSKPLMGKLNNLLDPPDGAYNKSIEIYYDTTFNIGNYYLSIFCYRYYVLDGNPVIPAAFLIHQRKFMADHKNFLLKLAESCPNLTSKPFAFITDREFTDVSSLFAKATHLYCWLHLTGDIRRWMSDRKHTGPDYQRRGTGSYKNDIETLLKSKSLQVFEDKFAELRLHWSPKFIDYFEKHVKDDIVKKACRWIVEPTGLYDRWSGVTTNAAESVNVIIQRSIRDTRKLTMDELVLTLYHWTTYYHYEISRGMCDVGNYRIAANFEQYRQDIRDLIIDNEICPPAMMATKVKEKLEQTKLSTVDPMYKCDRLSLDGANDNALAADDSSANVDIMSKNVVCNQDLKEKMHQLADTTQIKVAKALCKQGKITLVSEKAVFVVEGGGNKKYCVTIFPKETCQCPSTTTCYHILAAKLSIGMTDFLHIRGKKNVTSLFSKKRKAADRYTGKKQPRKGDYERQLLKNCSDGEILTPKFTSQREESNAEKLLVEIRREIQQVENRLVMDFEQGFVTVEFGGQVLSGLEKKLKDLDARNAAMQLQLNKTIFLDACGEVNNTYENLRVQLMNSHQRIEELLKRVHGASTSRQKTTPGMLGDKLSENLPYSQAMSDLGIYGEVQLTKDTQQTRWQQSGGSPSKSTADSGFEHPSQQPMVESTNDSASIYCVCQQPHDERRRMASCDHCRNWFHEDCLRIPKDVFTKRSCYWECDDCWRLGVLKWGGKVGQISMRNTCPIDSVLTVIHAFEKLHPKYLPSFGDHPAEAALHRCLKAFRLHQYDSEKLSWIQFIESQNPRLKRMNDFICDLYGSQDELFFDHFQHIWTVEFVAICSNNECSQKLKQHRRSYFSLQHTTQEDSNYDVASCIARVGFPLDGPCTTKKDVVCPGFRRSRVAKFCSKQPLLLPVDVSTIPVQNFNRLPLEFTCQRRSFTCGGFVLHGSDHFTSIIRMDNRWYFYDGYTSLKLLDSFALSQLFESVKLAKVLYFLRI